MSNTFSYIIDEDNTLKIYRGNTWPLILQPTWPNGTPWSNRQEVEAWADLYIEHIENPESEYIPGNSPDNPKVLRPVEETVEEPSGSDTTTA